MMADHIGFPEYEALAPIIMAIIPRNANRNDMIIVPMAKHLMPGIGRTLRLFGG